MYFIILEKVHDFSPVFSTWLRRVFSQLFGLVRRVGVSAIFGGQFFRFFNIPSGFRAGGVSADFLASFLSGSWLDFLNSFLQGLAKFDFSASKLLRNDERFSQVFRIATALIPSKFQGFKTAGKRRPFDQLFSTFPFKPQKRLRTVWRFSPVFWVVNVLI